MYGGYYPQQGSMWGGYNLLNNALNGPGGAMNQMATINAGNRNAMMANRQMGSGGGYNGSAAGMDPTLARLLQNQSYNQGLAQIASPYYGALQGLGTATIGADAGNQQGYYSNVMGPGLVAGEKTKQLEMLLPLLAGMFGAGGLAGQPGGYTTNYGAGVYPMQPGGQQAGRGQMGMQPPTGMGRMGGGMGGGGVNPYMQWAMQSAPGGQYGGQSAQAMGYSGQPAFGRANQYYADKRMRQQNRQKAGPRLTLPQLSMPGATGASILG